MRALPPLCALYAFYEKHNFSKHPSYRSNKKTTGFADYVDCLNTLTSYARFKSQLRSTNIHITVVVPWHLPKPSNASNRPYLFTHERAVSFDCMTVVHPTGKSTDTGYQVFGISSPAVNRKNVDGSTLVSMHQCIAACDDEACHLGSVVWVARDLVQRALEMAGGV